MQLAFFLPHRFSLLRTHRKTRTVRFYPVPWVNNTAWKKIMDVLIELFGLFHSKESTVLLFELHFCLPSPQAVIPVKDKKPYFGWLEKNKYDSFLRNWIRIIQPGRYVNFCIPPSQSSSAAPNFDNQKWVEKLGKELSYIFHASIQHSCRQISIGVKRHRWISRVFGCEWKQPVSSHLSYEV